MWRIRWFFVEYLPKVASYARFLWHDRDWEDSDILRLLRFKLRRVREGIARYGHHIDKEKTCEEIRLAELFIDRIVTDNYGLDEFMAHQKKWRITDTGRTFLSREHLSDDEKRREGLELRWLFEREDILRNQDLDLLFRHLRKHLRTWWD